MDIQVTNKVIGTTESLFDDFDERPVDCDFVLPDYLPDIAAVLKCTMKPVVQSKQLSGDRLSRTVCQPAGALFGRGPQMRAQL